MRTRGPLWFLALVLLLPGVAWADGQQFSGTCSTISWNQNTEPDLAGYRLYDRVSLTAQPTLIATYGIQVTSVTCASLGLNSGQHYMTLRAYDTSGNESGSSTEIAFVLNRTTTVNDLRIIARDATSATLAWTEVNDGLGAPATYDVRMDTPSISWGTAPSVTSGTCAGVVSGSAIGATKSCTVTGLTVDLPYQFQLVPYRGTLNVDAVFLPISNIASTVTTTTSATSSWRDSFDRTDATGLGSPWAIADSEAWAIVSNAVQFRGSTGPVSGREVYVVSLPDRQSAEIRLSTLTGSADITICLMLRATSTLSQGYALCAVSGSGGGSRIYRRTSSSTADLLASDAMGSWASSDVLRGEADGQALRVYRNGIKVLEANDGAYPSGYAGLWGTLGSGTTANVRLDSWVAESLTFVTGPLRPSASNPRYLVDDTGRAKHFFGISGGTNTNAAFSGVQDLIRYDFSNLTTSQVFSDTFDGTASDVGSLWTPTTWGGSTWPLTKVSGMLRPTNMTAFASNAEIYTGNLSTNPYACITLGTFNDAGAQKAGIIFATSTSSDNGYEIRAVRNTSYTTRVNRYDAGVSTTLDDENATTWAAGDELCAEKNGPVITVKRNGTAVAGISVSDATYTTVFAGVMLGGTNSAASTEVTSFKAGNIVADYATNLDAVRTSGGNLVRYWIMEQSAWCSDASCAANTYIRIPWTQFPWTWTGTTRADTSTGTTIDVPVFDLDTLNQSFFDRVVARVDAALARGITPIVTMFSGGHLLYGLPPSWNAGFSNPFYSGNNTNGVACDTNANEACEESHSLTVPAITTYQQAYVCKLVQSLGNRSGILEVSNEDQTDSTDWQNMIMEQVRTCESLYSVNTHMILQSAWNHGALASNAHLFDNPRNNLVAPVCTSNGDNYDTNPPRSTTKPVLYDSDHTGYADSCGVEVAAWPLKSLLRGISTIYLSERESSGTQTDIKAAGALALYYANKIDLANMIPAGDTAIFSTGYGLSNGSTELLMYLPAEGTESINLAGLSGDFDVEYMDPATGEVSSGGIVTGGGSPSFNPSWTGPAVVYLKAAAAAVHEVCGCDNH